VRVGWEWGGRRGFWGDDGRGLGVGGGGGGRGVGDLGMDGDVDDFVEGWFEDLKSGFG